MELWGGSLTPKKLCGLLNSYYQAPNQLISGGQLLLNLADLVNTNLPVRSDRLDTYGRLADSLRESVQGRLEYMRENNLSLVVHKQSKTGEPLVETYTGEHLVDEYQQLLIQTQRDAGWRLEPEIRILNVHIAIARVIVYPF